MIFPTKLDTNKEKIKYSYKKIINSNALSDSAAGTNLTQ